MVNYIILHCCDFDDDGHQDFLEQLNTELCDMHYTVELYNLPKSNQRCHWAAFALYDYSRYCDCLVCVDYPAAFAEHKRKKVIIQFTNTSRNTEFTDAIMTAKEEAYRVIDANGMDEKALLEACMEALI